MDISDHFLYNGIIMYNSDLAGRQIIPGYWPAIRIGPRGEFRLDPLHASWRFPALRESQRAEHSHGVFHFLHVIEGSGSFLIAGDEVPVTAPMLFLISPTVSHVFSTTMNQALIYHEFTFALQGQGAPETWKEILDFYFPGFCAYGVSHNAADPCRAIRPDSELSDRIGTVLLGLIATMSGRTHESFLDAYTRMLFTLAAEARLESTDSCSGMGRKEEGSGTDSLSKVMSYLEQHSTEHFPLALLAGMAGLSEKHLCRAFRKRFGMTIFQAKRAKVLERAERLLISTRYPLKQIAQMTGFLDEYHFSKAFRQHFGQPPGHYRKGSGYNQHAKE
jgi:AraC-like DNA-binding protein/mannose-6-phosphate isomerase-like protein (cupin superfamily)